MWLAWTILVDFFIIRTIFQTIDNFFQAGDLGIALFLKLNNLELILSTILVGIYFLLIRQKKNVLSLFILSLMCWGIVMFYFSYLTPKLVMLTNLWKTTDLMGISGVNGIADIQQEHQFYHRLYISLDAIKLLLLGAMVTIGLIKAEKPI
jgi:hypothetical protein